MSEYLENGYPRLDLGAESALQHKINALHVAARRTEGGENRRLIYQDVWVLEAAVAELHRRRRHIEAVYGPPPAPKPGQGGALLVDGKPAAEAFVAAGAFLTRR